MRRSISGGTMEQQQQCPLRVARIALLVRETGERRCGGARPALHDRPFRRGCEEGGGGVGQKNLRHPANFSGWRAA
jgi:hypothetical protein